MNAVAKLFSDSVDDTDDEQFSRSIECVEEWKRTLQNVLGESYEEIVRSNTIYFDQSAFDREAPSDNDLVAALVPDASEELSFVSFICRWARLRFTTSLSNRKKQLRVETTVEMHDSVDLALVLRCTPLFKSGILTKIIDKFLEVGDVEGYHPFNEADITAKMRLTTFNIPYKISKTIESENADMRLPRSRHATDAYAELTALEAHDVCSREIMAEKEFMNRLFACEVPFDEIVFSELDDPDYLEEVLADVRGFKEIILADACRCAFEEFEDTGLIITGMGATSAADRHERRFEAFVALKNDLEARVRGASPGF
jgi:hypothetical protein